MRRAATFQTGLLGNAAPWVPASGRAAGPCGKDAAGALGARALQDGAASARFATSASHALAVGRMSSLKS